MQGYIININQVRDEDLIVTILGQNQIYTTYRFYGVRHSNINIGYKIDFELDLNSSFSMPRLKDVMQLGFSWILDKDKLYYWQQYLKLFYKHFQDVEKIDNYYLNTLNKLANIIQKQNVKRAICENYIDICRFEGRLHKEYECLLCDKKILNNASLIRGFLLTHSKCNYGRSFNIKKIKDLFDNQSLVAFEDDEIEYLWDIILQGL